MYCINNDETALPTDGFITGGCERKECIHGEVNEKGAR